MAHPVGKSTPDWPSLGGRRFIMGLIVILGVAVALLLLIRYTAL